MKAERAIERLCSYLAELKGIRSRFTHSRDAIRIADGDDEKLHQMVIEIRDLFDDVLGPNDYSSMVVRAFNEGMRNWLQSPSLGCVEKLIGIVSAASTRFKENPGVLEQNRTADSRRTVGEQEKLVVGGQITLHWLYKNVPFKFWVWAATLLISAFGAGVTLGAALPVIREWLGIA